MDNSKQKKYWKPKFLILIHSIIFCILVILLFSRIIPDSLYAWIAGLYFVLVLFIFFDKVLYAKKNFKDTFRKDVIEIYIITFLIIFFFIMCDFMNMSANKINPNRDFLDYQFNVRIMPENNIVLNSLKYYYDFNLQKGNIYFVILETNNSIPTQRIWINLPSQLKVTNVKVYNQSKELVNGVDYPSFDYGERTLQINDIKQSLEGYHFNISFDGDISPNGNFRFYTFTKYAYSDVNDPVTFYLGEYYCQDLCYGRLFNAEPEFNGRELIVRYPENYYENTNNEPKMLQQQVSLNTYYQPDKTRKENLFNVYVSLFVSALLLFGELLRKLVVIIISK
jgi:hypothetical protein